MFRILAHEMAKLHNIKAPDDDKSSQSKMYDLLESVLDEDFPELGK